MLHTARIDPERRAHQREKTAPEHAGADEQGDGQRDLDGHQNAARTYTRAVVRRAGAAGERTVQVARGTQRGQQAEDAGGRERRHARRR